MPNEATNRNKNEYSSSSKNHLIRRASCWFEMLGCLEPVQSILNK
jgi:hypothetical protein